MFRLFFASIFLILSLNASSLQDKIENLLGSTDYQTHHNLINFIFKNESNFMINENINFNLVVKKLQENGLLKLAFEKPKEIVVEFHVNKDPIKSLKMLKESLNSLGYYYYFTKSTKYDGEDNLIWVIKLTTEAAIDPLVLSTDLLDKGCKVLDITKEQNDRWIYKINTRDATIGDTISLISGEKVVLKKPLKPYMIKIDNARQIYIVSRVLNNWFPYVAFYDEHLNILNVVKEDKVYRKIRLKVPEGTRYIKISDLYTLINIKRGLSVVIKE